MKLNLLDVAVGLWVIFAGAAFIVPNMLGGGWLELELVARYVYVVVLAAGLIGLAVRYLRLRSHQ